MIARVVAIVGAELTVQIADKPTPDTALCLKGIAPAVGDWVLLILDRGTLWALGEINASTVEVTEPLGVVTTGGTQAFGFGPSWSGSYRGGWRGDTSHMIQGTSSWGTSKGAAWFGRGFKGRDLQSVQVRCERLTYGSYSSQRPTMALLPGLTRPSGYPTPIATASGPLLGAPGTVKWWTLPDSWLSHLKSGSAGGIGITGSTYMRLDGPGFRAKGVATA